MSITDLRQVVKESYKDYQSVQRGITYLYEDSSLAVKCLGCIVKGYVAVSIPVHLTTAIVAKMRHGLEEIELSKSEQKTRDVRRANAVLRGIGSALDLTGQNYLVGDLKPRHPSYSPALVNYKVQGDFQRAARKYLDENPDAPQEDVARAERILESTTREMSRLESQFPEIKDEIEIRE